MGERPRVVIDTNVLVSRLLVPHSLPARAVRHAADHGRLLVSEARLTELADVFARPKFDAYLSIAERRQFLVLLVRIAERVTVLHPVQACRDPKDGRLLEVAVNGAAARVITGDAELLALDPFRGIPILTPADYLARFA